MAGLLTETQLSGRKPFAARGGRPGWLGFGGRIFLTEQEHETYCRRLPVRYPAKNLTTPRDTCSKCGGPASPTNPLQAAHIVPFGVGIIRFWLTPEWLDGSHNLIWAHKLRCNKECEVAVDEIPKYLKRKFGIEIPIFRASGK